MQGGDFSAATNGSVHVANTTWRQLCRPGWVHHRQRRQQPGCFDSGGCETDGALSRTERCALDHFYRDHRSRAYNYEYVGTVPNNTRTLDVRIDHTLNKKNQIFGRYAFDWSNYSTPPTWT